MRDNEIYMYKELLPLIGVCLIASQRMEFLSQGLVSLINDVDKDKQFKNINPKSFLENSVSGVRLRKKTLGQLIEKTKIFDIIDEERLEKYVKLRNFIVHNLWREELNEKIKEKDFNKCIKLCNEFISESNEIENSFKGFMYLIYVYLKTENNASAIDSLEKWIVFENDYMKNRK